MLLLDIWFHRSTLHLLISNEVTSCLLAIYSSITHHILHSTHVHLTVIGSSHWLKVLLMANFLKMFSHIWRCSTHILLPLALHQLNPLVAWSLSALLSLPSEIVLQVRAIYMSIQGITSPLLLSAIHSVHILQLNLSLIIETLRSLLLLLLHQLLISLIVTYHHLALALDIAHIHVDCVDGLHRHVLVIVPTHEPLLLAAIWNARKGLLLNNLRRLRFLALIWNYIGIDQDPHIIGRKLHEVLVLHSHVILLLALDATLVLILNLTVFTVINEHLGRHILLLNFAILRLLTHCSENISTLILWNRAKWTCFRHIVLPPSLGLLWVRLSLILRVYEGWVDLIEVVLDHYY